MNRKSALSVPLFLFALFVALILPVRAASAPVSLMQPEKANLGWIFDNGQEFKGATGQVVVDPARKHDGQDSLHLTGDFNNGGAYVRTGTQIDGVDIRELTMWLKSPDLDHVTMRIIDSAGQCHQINFKIQQQDDWQKFSFPLQQFFAKTEVEGANPVNKYESWGGPADQKWHGPAKSIDIIVGPTETKKVVNLWVNNVTILPAAPEAVSTSTIITSQRLDEIIDGQHDWTFDNGEEFPGAKGALTVAQDQPAAGQSCLQLAGDFSGGGNYVQMLKNDLSDLGGDLQQIRFSYKTAHLTSVGVRLIDSSGQCHQAHFPTVADGQWHDYVLKVSDVVGGEHWGGANDGKWHGPAKGFAMLMGSGSDTADKTPAILFANINADVLSPAVAGAPSFKSDFEGSAALPAGWTAEGGVSIDSTQAFKGKNSLLLSRAPNVPEQPCSAVSPSFKITPGMWKFDLAAKSNLVSPDASYDGVVTLEYLAGDAVVDKVTLADIFGGHNWQPVTKQLQPPAGATAARFRVQLNKTSGQFWVDEISAAFLSAAPSKDDRIVKLYFDSAQVGNLIYPEDPRTFKATVETTKPLDDKQLTLTYVVTDYWGAEQIKPGTIALTRATGRVNNHFAYTGTVDLTSAPLEVGRYYELQAEIPRGDEPYRNHTMFAIVPEAASNSFKPLEIPFTSRDWDDRIPEYFTLSHRLGIRICCIWSGWDADHPDQPYAPGIDQCAKLGMGVIAGTAAGAVEGHGPGYEKYTEQVLREGTRNLITKFSKVTQPFILDMGNEPHGDADRIKDDVKAYSYIYDEAKKTDPSIMVLGTSCGPDEGFFKAGFGQYCDAYDFHIYEDSHNVGVALQQYQQLFKTYGHPQPVWSTELGLNSQGVSRHAVAVDMVKKFAIFFANGGAYMSWFDLLYPDPDAKNVGGSGEAQDVFDSRYVKFAPKLTAVMYYDLINSILDKKFVAEKDYGDTHLYLFRNKDNQSLIIAWKDKGRQDISLPLPGVSRLGVTRIDTRRRTLDAGGKGFTLTFDEDPILLRFDGAAALPDVLGSPAASFAGIPSGLVRGATTDVTVALSGASADAVDLIAPPFWDVKKEAATVNGQPGLRFTLTAPDNTTIREADLIVTLKGANGGEIYLRPPVTGQLSSTVVPVPPSGDQPPGVKLVVKNNGNQNQDVTWDMSLTGQQTLKDGTYPEAPSPSSDAYFAGTPSGSMTLAGGQSSNVVVPLNGVDPQNTYQVTSTLTDATGRTATRKRNVAGFVAVPRVKGAIKLDGVLDDPDWKNAPVEKIDEARQYFSFDPANVKWKGLADLSGTIRFLWDDKYLYVGVEVTDDVFSNTKQDGDLWGGDGLQFLIDPCRGLDESVGKYDYTMGVGTKGPQAWCNLTADGSAPNGEAKDITVAYKRKGDGTGAITYELAIPWTRLAPFKPGPDADLGLTMILNEDDGQGRKSFMTWFGNASSKQVDTVGDLILQP